MAASSRNPEKQNILKAIKDGNKLFQEEVSAAEESSRKRPKHETMKPYQIRGLGYAKLPKQHLDAFRSFFDNCTAIVSQKNGGSLANWNGGYDDRRGRCYGFPPGRRQDLAAHSIKFHMREFEGEEAAEDEERNLRCSVDLVHQGVVEKGDDNGQGGGGEVLWSAPLREAVAAVADLVKPQLEEKYRACLDHLVALQPNQHNGTDVLPLHLDEPSFEGFGVVVVTIAMAGSATIVLNDEGGVGEEACSWHFSLGRGDLYFISGDARNKCHHGVLVDPAHRGRRESLNLRFGLHDVARESSMSAYHEVGRHWEQDV
mmetsp:Transcript_57397/g.113131  ORF Transcript_57397/g.113131 Transcript_57397/m.113131 type:complete len:315 (-) Transcript_57397:101-1045(-)